MLKEIGNLHMIPPIRKSKLDTKIVIWCLTNIMSSNIKLTYTSYRKFVSSFQMPCS
jgi:hypothetical protein